MKNFKPKQIKFVKTIFISALVLLTFSCSQEDKLESFEASQNLINNYRNAELLKLEAYALKYSSNSIVNSEVGFRGKSYKKGEGWAKGKKVNVLLPLHFMYGGNFDVTQVQNYYMKYKNGKMKGTFDLTDFDPENNLLEKISGKIVGCVFEEDCNTIRITGQITSSKNNDDLIGKFVMWTSEDNGIRKNGNRTTDIRYGIPEFVANMHITNGFPEVLFPKYEIASGDVQIKAEKCEDNK